MRSRVRPAARPCGYTLAVPGRGSQRDHSAAATASRRAARWVFCLQTMKATAATMMAAPADVVGVIGSESTSAPRITATTGFTNAYVATSDTDAFCKSQVYALYATSEPNTMR